MSNEPVEQTERHGRCRRQPYARELEHAHGVHRFQLECSGWHATGNWTKDVTTPEAAALVRAFVDATLAAQGYILIARARHAATSFSEQSANSPSGRPSCRTALNW
ncbi:hypothetical protein ACFXBB_38845 [Streptomyces scopuliridis]|uniref:hypothetical protein n=1 Tax=Streptomyces scopuliridis TaxID=452529 RepID=UPI0036951208